jgi:hypothetical protein
MIERNSFPHPHVDMMSNLIGLPYNPFSRIRDEKSSILAKLGLDKNDIHEITPFPMPSKPDNLNKLHESIKKSIDDNRNVLIVGYDTSVWNSNLGAHPEATLIDNEEMKKRLITKDNKLVAVQTQRGELLTPDTSLILLATYPKSRHGVFSGFDGDDSKRDVRLGGGFRIQIDDIEVQNNEVCLKLAGLFCYDDSHERVLALSSEDDKNTPRSEQSFDLRFRDGLLFQQDYKEMNLKEIINNGQIHDYASWVIEQILGKNRAAVTTLIRLMLTSYPTTKMHQLEGFFNLQGDELRTIIIDFDGIDNIDTLNYHEGLDSLTDLGAKEKLISAKLAGTGFLMSDPEALFAAYKQRQQIEQIKSQIRDNSLLPDEIQQSSLEHLDNKEGIFKKELTGPVKLGRLLKTLDVDFSPTEYEWLKIFDFGQDKIYFLDINGYDLAYWEKIDKLIDTSKIRALTSELSKLMGKQIVEAHLNTIHEGD